MSQSLPKSVDRFLREYTRQRNSLLFWRGFLMAFIVVLGWLVVWCLVDRSLQISAAWRTVILLCTASAVTVWLILLFRTLLSRVAPQDAALELESLRPDLDERLATICSRLADDREGLASRQMLEAIAQQLESYIQEKGVPKIVSFGSLSRHVVCSALLVFTLLTIWMMPLIGMPQLMERLLTPWSGAAPVTTTRLATLFDKRQLDLKEHEAVILNAAAVNPGEGGVVLHYSTDGQTWEIRPMHQVDAVRFQASVGPINNDYRFYLSSGDAKTPISTLTLLRRPAIAEFRIRYEYPAYMKRDPFIARNVDGLLEAPVGTKAAVQVVATEKVKSADLQTADFTIPLRSTIEPTVMEGEVTITRDQPYSIAMVSAKGIDGKGPQGSQIRALPDRPPFIQLTLPTDDIRLGPRDLTSIRFQAIDDYGIDNLAMKLQVNNAQPIEVPIRLGDDIRRRDGDEELDMANLGLKVGDVVAVSLAATDGARQNAASETRYLFISPHSVNTADYTRMSELQRSAEISKALAQQIDAAAKTLDKARAEKAHPEKYSASAEKYQQHIADSGQQAENLRSSLTRAIARTEDGKLSDTLATFADRAEVRMIEAHDLIDELGKGDAREVNARQRLDRSLEQTRQMQQQLEALANAERAAAALADRRNLTAAQQAQQTGKMTARAAEMLDRMRQDVNDQARQLGLNPDDPSIEKQLEGKVAHGKKTTEQAKQVDLVEAAQSWSDQLLDEKIHAPMFDRRLSAAADVESVRTDSDLERAGDLDISSRAAQAIWLMSRDPEARAAADQIRKDFVKAFSDLEKQHAAEGKSPDQEEDRRAADARARMAEWAGEASAQAGPDDISADEMQQRQWAIEANEHMYNRRYDRASELQRRMALEQQQALEAAEALGEAQAVDEIAQSQDALRQQLQASQAEAAALAQRQREVARRIDSQIGEMETSIPGAPLDTRKDALAAIQAVQERLAMMPQQLQESLQSADVQFQAHDLAERLKRDAQNAAPPRKEAADRAAERATVAEADARKQTETSLAPVDADVTRVMVSSLADFLPETVNATRVLEQQLAPSLQKVKQGAADNKAPDMLRAIKQSREAIANAQSALRDAQQALLDRDPLFAARMYAEAAAEALSKHPPDMAAASENQALASDALNRQWNQSIRDAAAAHLSGVSEFRDVYAEEARRTSPADRSNLATAREWGMLRTRQDGEISAAAREEDPTGYQKMIQVYFRTLGKTRQEGGR